MEDWADELAAEARAMFAHLPAGEIEDDEDLFFRVPAVRLWVFLPRTGGYYYSHEGGVRRYRVLRGGAVEVSEYRDGHPVKFFTVDPHKREGPSWPPWMN